MAWADLVGDLVEGRYLDPRWEPSFLAVPRRAFVASRCWAHWEDGRFHATHGGHDVA